MDRNAADLVGKLVELAVALREESVDRNAPNTYAYTIAAVALREESVDRNAFVLVNAKLANKVALREESVDRNIYNPVDIHRLRSSLSARRAWIEMWKMKCW